MNEFPQTQDLANQAFAEAQQQGGFVPAKTGGKNQKRADAWLNISIKDANGDVHNLGRGIALDLEKQLDRSIINAVKANGEDLVLTLQGTVNIAKTEEELAQDIQLF